MRSLVQYCIRHRLFYILLIVQSFVCSSSAFSSNIPWSFIQNTLVPWVLKKKQRNFTPAFVSPNLTINPLRLRPQDLALLEAAKNNQTYQAKFLITHNFPNVNAGAPNITPLHWAAYHGNLDLISFLCAHGANVWALDAYKKTPFEHAIKREKDDAAYFLYLKIHSTPIARSLKQWIKNRLLSIAAKKNDTLLMIELINAGAEVQSGVRSQKACCVCYVSAQNVRNPYCSNHSHRKCYCPSTSPLHWMAYHGNKHMVEFLLQHQADALQQDSTGKTPIQYAIERGNYSTAYLLFKKQVDRLLLLTPMTRQNLLTEAIRQRDNRGIRLLTD